MHHCRSYHLCACVLWPLDIRYKPLLACAHECKPNLVVLWPMGQSNKEDYILAYIHTHIFPYKLKIVNKPLGQMLCYSAEENQQEYFHISHVDDHKAELWSVDH